MGINTYIDKMAGKFPGGRGYRVAHTPNSRDTFDVLDWDLPEVREAVKSHLVARAQSGASIVGIVRRLRAMLTGHHLEAKAEAREFDHAS